MERVSPRPIEARQQDHEKTVAVAKGGKLDRAARHDQLLTQDRILGDELAFRAYGVLNDARHGPVPGLPDRSAADGRHPTQHNYRADDETSHHNGPDP